MLRFHATISSLRFAVSMPAAFAYLHAMLDDADAFHYFAFLFTLFLSLIISLLHAATPFRCLLLYYAMF